MAQAALLGVGETPRTHAGLRARFYVHFVEAGPLSLSTASTLGQAHALRQGADYDISPVFDTQTAADLLADVDAFVQAVEPLLTP